MKEVLWNGGYYREGGSVIYNGQIKTIKRLEIDFIPKGASIFDRKRLLRVITEDGKVIESVER